MRSGNWVEIKKRLQDRLKVIFRDYDIEALTNYEKRKIIFDFLCNTLFYDFDLYQQIKDNSEFRTPIERDLYSELMSVFDNGVGICNAISQYYKLLLDQMGIFAYCIICHDGTSVNHQLNLVYDKEHDTYSFDDVTSVIVGRGSIDEYFDYNIEMANSYDQGKVVIFRDSNWAILPEDAVYFLVGKHLKNQFFLVEVPKNIECVVKKKKLQ